MLHVKQTRLDLDEIYKHEMSLDLIPFAGVVVVIGAVQSPHPKRANIGLCDVSRIVGSMSDLCLRAVAEPDIRPECSQDLSPPAARLGSLTAPTSVCLFLTSLLLCQCVCGPADLSAFSVCLYVCPAVCGSGLLARESAFPHAVWMHDLIRTTDHALEI